MGRIGRMFGIGNEDDSITERLENNESNNISEVGNSEASESKSEGNYTEINQKVEGSIVADGTNNKSIRDEINDDLDEMLGATDKKYRTVGGMSSREAFISYAVESTISYFTSKEPEVLNMYDRGAIGKEDVEELVKKYISKDIRLKGQDRLTEEEVDKVWGGFQEFTWGYDIIEPLIADLEISDININTFDTVCIKRNGERGISDIKFRSVESFKKFVDHMTIKNRRGISELEATQSFTDKKASDKFILRISMSTGVVASNELPLVSIRKIPKFKYGFDALIEKGVITRELVEYIRNRIEEGHGFGICGKGGVGKTILLNEMLELFPLSCRTDVIQDNDELFSYTHPDMIFHTTVEPQGEAKIRYDLSKLARHALLEDLDAVVIGEVKGKEASVLAHATYTGHQAFCTGHASSARAFHYKLADYAREGSGEEPETYLPKLAALDTVIFMSNFKITEVVEVVGFDRANKTLMFRDVDVVSGKVVNA